MNDAADVQESGRSRSSEAAKLKVFVLGPDWWLATDLEALKKVIAKEAWLQEGKDYDEGEIEELADTAEIKLWADPEDCDMPTEINAEGAHTVTKTAKEWAELIGKEGMLGSTEY